MNSKGSFEIIIDEVGKLFNNSIKISYIFRISCQLSFFILIILGPTTLSLLFSFETNSSIVLLFKVDSIKL